MDVKSDNIVRTRKSRRISPVQEYLCSDICKEILCRLPVKALLKFRLVCKTWRSIIDDPKFVCRHLTHYKNNIEKKHLLVVEEHQQYNLVIRHCDTYRKIGVPDKSPLEGIPRFDLQVAGYINGLFVFWVRNEDRMTVWNPSIKRYFFLPSLRISRCEKSTGFGFDPTTNEYKVVSVCQQCRSRRDITTTVYVYTLGSGFGSGSWRVVSRNDNFPYFSQNKVFMNGRIYWVTDTDLFSFDLAEEYFTHCNIPNYGSIFDKAYITVPVIRGESLALLSGFSNHYWCLWVKDEHAEHGNWTKIFSINEMAIYQYVYFKMNGEILFTTTDQPWIKGLHLFDINTNEKKVIAKSYCARVKSAHAYVESLVWPKGAV